LHTLSQEEKHNMPLDFNPVRRLAIHSLGCLAATALAPSWAQNNNKDSVSKTLTLVQVADVSANQIDVSKDFVVGSRAAWQDINANGGFRGRPVQHRTVEVDGSEASLRQAVDAFKGQSQVIAYMGTVGGQVAERLADLMRREVPDIPHIAPWLQNANAPVSDNTFPIFAPRQDQITHAVRTLSLAGVTEMGAVYASPSEYANYHQEVQRTAAALNMRVTAFGPIADLQHLAQTLTPQSPRLLIFLGGTPELLQFTQGITKQADLRYVIAMSDVNLQTLSQVGMSPHAPVIATQVVPLLNTSAAVVRAYRSSLVRFFDEPPTPQGLAGFIASRYVFETMQSLEGSATRANLLRTLQKRASTELGGFRIDLDGKRRGGTFVTQSMLSRDGRIIG
jgi:ABC-type branched-subunit amino acid transport system substrate-binding protein